MDFSQVETVTLDTEEKALVILDQTRLPNEIKTLRLTKQEDIWEAIYKLRVRGAPAIGVAAAIGYYLAAEDYTGSKVEEFRAHLAKSRDYLNSSRPTAVNLSWALARMEGVLDTFLKECRETDESERITGAKKRLMEEAIRIREEDIEVCRSIGEHALALLRPGMGLLTHCNAGRLATVKYGTATAAMYLGHERGYGFHVYCDETRPLLQGARLTAFELSAAGIDTTLLCDNMAPTLMRQGKIQAVFVGCDRVAANGDAANKIGTSYVALAAKEYGIPFYVCAPTSTIDLVTPTGADIVIEQRPGNEVTDLWYEKPMAPAGVKVFNPAFDVTEAKYITAIITEKGICSGNLKEELQRIRK